VFSCAPLPLTVAEIADNSKVRVHVGSSAAKPFYFRVPGSGGAYYVTTLHHCNCLAYFNQVTVHKTHLMCKVSQRREARREDTDAASWQLDRAGSRLHGTFCSRFSLISFLFDCAQHQIAALLADALGRTEVSTHVELATAMASLARLAAERRAEADFRVSFRCSVNGICTCVQPIVVADVAIAQSLASMEPARQSYGRGGGRRGSGGGEGGGSGGGSGRGGGRMEDGGFFHHQ
jgi:uncharacterized membrane protein YgcG